MSVFFKKQIRISKVTESFAIWSCFIFGSCPDKFYPFNLSVKVSQDDQYVTVAWEIEKDSVQSAVEDIKQIA